MADHGSGQHWAQVYEKQTRVRINYQSIGSGGGIRQFIERTVDFGATDGPMADDQIAQAGGRPLHIPTVAGAVVPIYNVTRAASGLRFTPVGIGAKGNEGVAELVRRMPNALGYAELTYAMAAKIPFGAVRNRAGHFVTPSLETTTAAVAAALDKIPADFRVFITDPVGADAYPIAGFTWS